MIQTPIEVPLLDRSKEELVAIIGRLKENLSWYVEERNRLIAESQAPQRLLERLRDGLSRMREGDRSGPSAQHMLEWVEQCIPAELGDGEPSPPPVKLGNCRTPHFLGEPTPDRKALTQIPHYELPNGLCKEWRQADE